LLSTISRPVRSWGHSHLLPVGRFPHLSTEIKLISPRCQDWGNRKGCHEALDQRNFDKIKNFDDLDYIMENLYKYDLTEYNKFVTGLEKAGCDKFLHEKFGN